MNGKVYFDIKEGICLIEIGNLSDGRIAYKELNGLTRIRPKSKLKYLGIGNFEEIAKNYFKSLTKQISLC